MLANALVLVVALMHLYFMILEMFLWDKPAGMKAFGLSAEFAQASKPLAANQGLYNGFLVAGLIWGLWLGSQGTHIVIFFLSCVIVAGVYGSLTVGKKILYVQAMPAAIALALVLFG